MGDKLPKNLIKFYNKYPEGIYYGEGKVVKIDGENFFFSDISGNKGSNKMRNSISYMNIYFEKDENFEDYNSYEIKYEDLYYIGLTLGGKQVFICINEKYYNAIFYEDYELEVFKKIFNSLEEFYHKLNIEV